MAKVALNDKHIQSSIEHAVRSVYKTMLRHEIKLLPPSATINEDRRYEVICNVNFLGDINGCVHLCLASDHAAFIASNVLGLSPLEIDNEMIKDALGEITNMTTGGFKNALCDLGHPCKLSLPTMARGHAIKAAAVKNTIRYIYDFDCEGYSLIADIQIQME